MQSTEQTTHTILRATQATTTGGAKKLVKVVTLPERFDHFASVDLTVEEDTKLVVDGRAVRFADLHALQSLVDARLESLTAGSDIVIGAPSDEFLAILELTGFGDLLNVVTSKRLVVANSVEQVILSGNLGPEHASAVSSELDNALEQSRPLVELDLVNVESMHLGVVNVLIAARDKARAKFGDITVIVGVDSPVHALLSQVGIVGTMRP